MSGPAQPQPADAAARRRIRQSLDESLLVEASAGTGKTTELVRRIVAVLSQGRATIDQIVAVTFTHKAAGELKLRLRQGLDHERTLAAGTPVAAHCERALARLEEASIGTIHSFCAQLLRERPVEARVDPDFRELAEDESRRVYNRVFQSWVQDRLGQASPVLERALSRLAWREPRGGASPPPLEQLKAAGWQLIEWRDFTSRWERVAFDRTAEIDRLAGLVLSTSERASSAFRALHQTAEWIRRAEAERSRDYDTVEALLARLDAEARREGRRGLEDLSAALGDFRRQADADLAASLHEEMRDLITRYEQAKRQAGELDFLDLLLLARALVRDNAEVRAYLQKRFTHIFVDEFQDTDPLQAELLILLAGDRAAESDWRRVRPAPGKFFAVGDPKQSIYKFRRADVLLYQALKASLEARGVGVITLSRSFRAVRPIQEAINAAFAPEMTGDGRVGQAVYSPLEEFAPALETQPAVIALPVARPYGRRQVTKAAIEQGLPEAVVAFTEWLVRASGWRVRDPEAPQTWIPLEARHIAILFRRFVNFGRDMTRDYTRGLEARGIPHLLVGSKSFHSREEVETLRMALAAIEWPDDELSVFGTLKGSLFALSDSLLLEFRHRYGRFHPFRPLPAELAPEFEPIAEALESLGDLHRRRNRRPFADTVNLLLERVRAHAGFALRPAGHQVLANVHRVSDFARAYESGGGVSFRGFVEFLARQSEKAEASEAPVFEEGADGVRLMTVHRAKGLEFPVVILADLAANIAAQEPERHVDAARGVCAARLVGCSPWELLERQPLEREREQAEGVRVAYVAATRARDLLVVPAVGDGPFDGWLSPLNKALYPVDHQAALSAPGCPPFGPRTVLDRPFIPDSPTDPSVRPGLHRPQSGHHTVVWWDPALLSSRSDPDYGLRQEEILAGGGPDPLARYHQWRARRDHVIQSGQSAPVTLLRASDTYSPPPGFAGALGWTEVPRQPERPRGARFGALVHAILAALPMAASASEIPPLADLHSRLLDAPREEAEAAAEAVRRALEHPLWQEARRAARCHREWPLIWRTGDHLVEGVLDLAFLGSRGWQVVDFKTDEEAWAHRDRYEAQLSWYVTALAALTGKPASGWILVL